MYVCKHVNAHVCMCGCIYTCVNAYVCIFMNACILVYMCVYEFESECMYIRVLVFVNSYIMHVHVCVSECMYIVCMYL